MLLASCMEGSSHSRNHRYYRTRDSVTAPGLPPRAEAWMHGPCPEFRVPRQPAASAHAPNLHEPNSSYIRRQYPPGSQRPDMAWRLLSRTRDKSTSPSKLTRSETPRGRIPAFFYARVKKQGEKHTMHKISKPIQRLDPSLSLSVDTIANLATLKPHLEAKMVKVISGAGISGNAGSKSTLLWFAALMLTILQSLNSEPCKNRTVACSIS